MTDEQRHFGKYRGVVINNVDPMQLGRLLVQVPDVLAASTSSWAMPCFPVAGPQMGFVAIPPVGAGVWVEFEQGDADHPIWSGGWFGSAAELPALALASPPPLSAFVLQTTGQATLQLSDLPGAGGILLRTASGAMISINETGITISNGQGASIVLSGPMVTVNGGALEVL